ncbi:prolyl oligopeptidase family serine peptidase [Pelomonas sp. KK5]|uniref:prolyl oligopeptidase family serine peptidase n=1 Tax=Pelomonas sp. KK5 TaxID=1855730 RepID=UPI00097C5B25|nr:prolyl oligopeptidase family serine peptidase [Pelomonas sp. KK5]
MNEDTLAGLRRFEEDTPEVLQWQREQDRLARESLHAGDAFERLDALLRPGYVDLQAFHAPRPVRGRWFHRRVPAGAALPLISVSETAEAAGRVLIDLASLGLPGATLGDMQPSPDGRRVLLTLDPGDGTMQTLVLLVDADGDAPPLRLSVVGPVSMPCWLPDGGGFLFAGLPLGVDVSALPPAPGLRIIEQRLDDEALTRTVLPLSHMHPFAVPQVSADGRHAFVCEDQTSLHPTWIRSLPDGDWQPFLDAGFGRVKGTVAGDEFIAVSNEGAPRGRLVAIPLATARRRDTWREILPAGEGVLVSVTPVGGKLVVGESLEGNARLRVVWPNGTVEHALAIPAEGAVGKFAYGFVTGLIDELVWADGNEISFVHSSLLQPPQAWRYDVRTGRLAALDSAGLAPQGSTLTTQRTPDRHAVAYCVLRAADTGLPAPTIVTGYGGFNVHWLPCWNSMAAAWVAAGGVWVHAHLRGGGEFGEDFWRDGRRENKANGFADLFAVMDDVVRQGITTPAKLGLFGSSNGSLLVSAAFARRPDGFGAGVAQVPIIDILGCGRDPATLNIVRAEYGDPLGEADATWIRGWSPLENLPEAARFPALLADAGAIDMTCPPWHARKLVAAVAGGGAAGSGPVLLRVREGAAHNVMSVALHIERDAETLAFFAQQLGLAS